MGDGSLQNSTKVVLYKDHDPCSQSEIKQVVV